MEIHSKELVKNPSINMKLKLTNKEIRCLTEYTSTTFKVKI